ncbi:hypothetical protein BC827DRAFT_53992 [Russula dissimulans]|nr:hypothetical protein BC827DRAFT_53992 [Russula dissimulans]
MKGAYLVNWFLSHAMKALASSGKSVSVLMHLLFDSTAVVGCLLAESPSSFISGLIIFMGILRSQLEMLLLGHGTSVDVRYSEDSSHIAALRDASIHW